MARYRFLSTWVLRAKRAAVYDALRDYESHPLWWPGVNEATLLREGDEDGVGAVLEYVVAGPLPYDLRFEVTVDAAERPERIAVAAKGELEGTGEWRLEEHGELTVARYAWAVATTKRWMNALATPARPLFSWAHTKVMRAGAVGLADHLGVALVADDSGTI